MSSLVLSEWDGTFILEILSSQKKNLFFWGRAPTCTLSASSCDKHISYPNKPDIKLDTKWLLHPFLLRHWSPSEALSAPFCHADAVTPDLWVPKVRRLQSVWGETVLTVPCRLLNEEKAKSISVLLRCHAGHTDFSVGLWDETQAHRKAETLGDIAVCVLYEHWEVGTCVWNARDGIRSQM